MIAVALGLALALCGLYLGVPAFQRRMQYVPVRIHVLLVKARRRRHPPALPPPALVTPAEVVTVVPPPLAALPTAPATSTPQPVARPTSIVPLGAPRHTPPPSPTPTPSPSSTQTPLPSATPTSSATPMPTRARVSLDLSRICHVYQDWNNCGPATLSMMLSFYGRGETQEDVR